MSYIGNEIRSVPFVTDIYSGAGGTSFGPLTIVPASPASVMIFVAGVYQRPTLDYTLNVDFVNYESPPSSGTNNIVIHHIGIGYMSTQVPGDGTVTPSKFSVSANSSIIGKSIAMAVVFGG